MRAETKSFANRPTPLHGAAEAATAALRGSLATIEDMHMAVARKSFAPLRLAPGVAHVSEAVRVLHDGITGLVYGGLRAAITATGAAARLGARLAPGHDEEPQPASIAGWAVSALNGFAGDRLERDNNSLAIEMGIRHRGRAVAPNRDGLAAAFPHATPRLAVFVHGLACNESFWQLGAERHYEDPSITYGARLQNDFGYTPVYLRYNTGLHISQNGRELAHLLDRMVGEWPVAVDDLILIGHSMGGLVCRSAGYYGQQAEHRWTRSVRHIVFLGSPHLGAPLEKAANIVGWLLGHSDITQPFAAVWNGRSVGIKDLRFGALVDEEWENANLDALLENRTGDVPFLAGARHCFVAATVTRDRFHPFGLALGDLLVREPSAAARGRIHWTQFRLDHGRHFGAMNHFDLLNHPDVYEQLRRWLDPGDRQRFS